MEYVADFETTTDVHDCRVWAWCVTLIEDSTQRYYGNNIESFLQFTYENGGIYWFHNAAFDCEFILYYLLTHGFEYSEKARTKTFKTLISNSGQFYQMKVTYEKKGKKKSKSATFKDSLKKLPMPVERIAKSFNLPIRKLSIDYTAPREIGHELTPQEIDYVTNDVVIVADALKTQFGKGLTRLTIGSDALNHYQDILGNKWADLFPKISLEMDENIRKAYRGGYTYAAPQFQADDTHPDRIQGAGCAFDVNSLYPDVMYHRPLPIGAPIWFKGEYTPDPQYPLYIQFLTCHCVLKPDHLPTLQIKHNPFFMETEYIHDTEGYVELALTSVDLEILNQQYDVTVLSYNGGYKFESMRGLFNEYIDYWMDIKAHSEGGIRQLAKLMLNSLYGKFATNPDVTPKVPYIKDNGSVGYKLGDKETRDPVYTPMGCFITAWARYKTINAAQSVYNRFMYCDTDSIHLLGVEPVEGLDVHPTRLGAWKHESNFSQAKYVRAKTYMERIVQVGKMVDGVYTMIPVQGDNGEPYIDDVKCAGLPAELKKQVTFDNFKRGLKLFGKLRPVHVAGGIVLKPSPFTLT